jgi:rubredoxin
MTDELTCKHCGVPLERDRYEDGREKNQEIPKPGRGVTEVMEMWSCPVCLSTFHPFVHVREMTPAELVTWAKRINKQVEVA